MKLEEIEAAEFKYISAYLKEDLYEAIVAYPFYTDPDFTTGLIDTSVKEVELFYSSGLTANGTAITGISNVTEAVFTLAGHGFSTDDVIYIAGTGAKTSGGDDIIELNRLLQYNKLKVTIIDTNTFKLTSNLVNDYLKAPLAYYTVGLAFNKIYVEVSDRGIVHVITDKTTTVDNKTRNDIRTDIFQIADALMGKARDYIYEQDFDDFDGALDDEDDYLNIIQREGQNKRVTHF